jgi:hypothetical protein
VPRSMTSAEKTQYQGWFPQLDVTAAVVSAESDPVYNCISWTVGVTTTWRWPGSTIQDFDSFYGGFGYVRRATGPIAVWGHSLQAMLHGSVTGIEHGPRWESKCGALLRIQHGRDELTSNTYGHIVAYYRFNWIRYVSAWIRSILWRKRWWLMAPDQLRILDESVAGMDPALRERFDRLFDEWKLGWSSEEVAIHSDPAAVRRLPQFEALVELGPQALPALARKLADPENFFALQLYDALADQRLADLERAGPDRGAGEQGRAVAVAAAFAQSLSRQPRSSRLGA